MDARSVDTEDACLSTYVCLSITNIKCMVQDKAFQHVQNALFRTRHFEYNKNKVHHLGRDTLFSRSFYSSQNKIGVVHSKFNDAVIQRRVKDKHSQEKPLALLYLWVMQYDYFSTGGLQLLFPLIQSNTDHISVLRREKKKKSLVSCEIYFYWTFIFQLVIVQF